jgi:hypothetical protein
MKFFRGVAMSIVFSLFFLGAAVAQEPAADSLPPEKTQLIYDTLLPSQGDENAKSDIKDAPATATSVKMVAQILRGKGIDLLGKEGQWQFLYEGMQIFLLTNPDSNRIRMMTPLAKLDQLRQNPDFRETDLLQKMLRANYLATGDIRFCMNRHIIWAAFLHPLDSLTERDFVDALEQLTEIARKTRTDIG